MSNTSKNDVISRGLYNFWLIDMQVALMNINVEDVSEIADNCEDF